MNHYIGIDLGTTNSAICSYDGKRTRIWKNPEQKDVTPSVILMDRRGNKYLGNRAYNTAPWQHENAALLFKRLIGTNTSINFPAVNITMTPQDCSVEILKLMVGYLPEEIRNDHDTGTVITVPAAFNQMQKDATMQAANMAGIGMVALMQEPVAAVMSVMQTNNLDSTFLIYDLGGGTLDIAIAESIAGHVKLLAHGGIAMCGGRDFDLNIMDAIVKPWLINNFDLPSDFTVLPKYKTLKNVALWVIEKAKIDLSSKDDTLIMLSEDEMRCKDQSGDDIYLEIPFNRKDLDELIAEKVADTIDAARDTISTAGLTADDFDSIIFIGGPTQYKPLRDKVVFELGISGNTDINPMTAVAEGASIFAESIDWSTQNRTSKTNRGSISTGGNLKLSFNYISRTPNPFAKVSIKMEGGVDDGSEVQIDSIDTGWTSGRLPLKDGTLFDVPLSNRGENSFKVFVYDSMGGPVTLEEDSIVINKTAALVDSIPASHSIGIEVLEKVGGNAVLHWLIRTGDALPCKGKITLKALECLKAGDSASLNFKLWEGENEYLIHDNRLIGVFKISGNDFADGVIPAGGSLEFAYEIMDSGNINVEVAIPDIQGIRSGNFYSWQGGQGGLDFGNPDTINYIFHEGNSISERINEISEIVDNPKLKNASKKLNQAISLDPHETEPENVKQAHENIYEAKKILAQVRKEHRKEIRQKELDNMVSFFDGFIRKEAKPSEVKAIENLAKTAEKSIDRNDKNFESYLEEIWSNCLEILWRQDWFVIDQYRRLSEKPYFFVDRLRFDHLVEIGNQYLRNDEIDRLRDVVLDLIHIQIATGSDYDINEVVNILRG